MGTCWNYKACDGHCGQVKKSGQKFLSVFPLWVKLAYKALNRNGAQVQRVEGWGTVSQDRKRYRFKTRKALFRPTPFLSDSEQSCPAIWTAITGQRKLRCRGSLSKTNLQKTICNITTTFPPQHWHIGHNSACHTCGRLWVGRPWEWKVGTKIVFANVL